METEQYLSAMNATPEERSLVLYWVSHGGSIADNPWHIAGGNGVPLNLIDALRFLGDMEAMAECKSNTP